MNKTLLIIICDFLLISLLAVARFDKLEPEEPAPEPEVAGEANPESDLIDVLKQSLEEERLAREEMDRRLNEARASITNRESQLADQANKIKDAQATIRDKDEEARRLAAARAALQAQLQSSQSNVTTLRSNFMAAQTNLTGLSRQVNLTRAQLEQIQKQKQDTEEKLQSASQELNQSQEDIDALKKELADAQSDARVNQQLVEALQNDLEVRVGEARVMQAQIQKLDDEREAAVVQSERLTGQLQVAKVETRMTTERLNATRQEVQRVQQEKAVIQKTTSVLAEGVSNLATQSVELTKEIRASQPLTPNTLFQSFISNRIHSSFQATRKGVFGQTVRRDKVANSILFQANNQTYALYHLSGTPWDLGPTPEEWSSLSATFRKKGVFIPMKSIRFLDRDPRILLAPLTAREVRELRVKPYQISKDMLKFEDAVLVGTTDSYYGECGFEIDPKAPGYMKMKREFLGKLFGKFVPSSGDLVFSKSGELIGMMANKEYCMVLDKLTAARRVQLGAELDGQYTRALLSQMYYQIMSLPFKLQ